MQNNQSKNLRAPLPHGHIDPKPDMWVQEAIFGHRFINEQLPFMLVLEALSVCRSDQVDYSNNPLGTIHSETRIFSRDKAKPGYHENLVITIPRQGPLRYLLFAAKSIAEIEKDNPNLSKRELFERWISEINEGYSNAIGIELGKTFAYLEHFASDPDCTNMLDQAIGILQGLRVDALNERRWTSQFTVPHGPHLLFHDLDHRHRLALDRRFFGRGGEMVYLMLNRSCYAEELAPLIHRVFFSPGNQLDMMAEKLSDEPDSPIQAKIGYLPLESHAAYDRMAEDWKTILDVPGTGPAQALRPLSDMTALNLVCYFIERAGDVLGGKNFKVIPLDMSDGGNRSLRSLAKEYLKRTKNIIDRAVEQYIRQEIVKTSEWQNLKKNPASQARSKLAQDAIKKAFLYQKIQNIQNIRKPDELLERFISLALKRTHNQISRLIEPLGKQAGFVTAKKGVGTWFNVSDEFLASLVQSNVSKPQTAGEFLERLYQRYGLVIGPQEAEKAFPSGDIDITMFEANLQALEHRLQGLGFVRRLSDDVAFVFNPYS